MQTGVSLNHVVPFNVLSFNFLESSVNRFGFFSLSVLPTVSILPLPSAEVIVALRCYFCLRQILLMLL